MINKHKIYELPLYLGISAVYIIFKYIISPILYLAKMIGLRSSFPSKIDATINKLALPLTERPDRLQRMDVEPRIKKGDPLPSIQLTFPNGEKYNLNEYAKGPLLLIFVRGSWCSYSRLHLSDIIANKRKFEIAGIELLAVSAYADQDWWRNNGIDIPMYIDADGHLFKAFGIQVKTWMEYAWGRNLPHESVFLFDQNGNLEFLDVRKVSGILPGQRFLGSDMLLERISNFN